MTLLRIAIPGVWKILAVGILLTLPWQAGLAWAEDADSALDDEFALLADEELVFSASKHVQHVSESPSAVTVITRDQIEHSACFDVACLLRSVPEVEVWRMLPYYHVVGARALTNALGDKTLVLIDGREDSQEAFGFPIWSSLPVHLEDIERIEVLRGPGSALYGANAHSLVVSITTRPPQECRVEAFVSSGEVGRFQFNARVDQAVGDWHLQASGGRELGESWQNPETVGLDLMRFRLRADRNWGETFGKTSAQAGMVSGGGQMYSALAPLYLTNTRTLHALVEHVRDPVTARIWFNLFDTHFSLDMPLAYQGFVVAQMPADLPLLASTLDAEVQTNWRPWQDNLLIAGANYRWLTLSIETNDPPEVNQHRVGLFVQDEQKLFDQINLIAGVRMDYNNITPDALTFSPRISAVWRFAEEQVLRSSASMAFRKPSFYNTHMHLTGVDGGFLLPDLEDFFRRAVGNDELGNETVGTVELGYRGRFLDGLLIAEATAFTHLYRNRIDFAADMEYDQYDFPILKDSSMNFTNNGGEVNAYGGSLTLLARPFDKLHIDANYTYRYCVYVTQPVNGEAPEGTMKGDQVPWVPSHLANFSARYATDFGLHLGFSMHYHSSSEQANLEDGDPFLPWITLTTPAAVFTNAFVSWRFQMGPKEGDPSRNWIELGLKAYNLFDQEFSDSEGVVRTDGQYIGAETVGRMVQVFARGAI